MLPMRLQCYDLCFIPKSSLILSFCGSRFLLSFLPFCLLQTLANSALMWVTDSSFLLDSVAFPRSDLQRASQCTVHLTNPGPFKQQFSYLHIQTSGVWSMIWFCQQRTGSGSGTFFLFKDLLCLQCPVCMYACRSEECARPHYG